MRMEVPLTSLAINQTAIIRAFMGGQHFQHKLRMMGIREGKTIKLLASQPLRGPFVIEIDRRELTIGRRMAHHIIVETIG
jgi:Fe2+ transport system protein FeoA